MTAESASSIWLFGELQWNDGAEDMRSPLLLVPVQLTRLNPREPYVLHSTEDERLQSGEITTFTARSLHGIAELLIKARIARGWTQAELGDALDMAVQQVQRYEATGYASASLARLSDVATALGVEITETAKMHRTA